MISSALFSDCKAHRFRLARIWNEEKETLLFIGLNPSRADHYTSDRTITKCISYAQNWNYGGLTMVNLFSFISPYPNELKRHTHLYTDENRKHIKEALESHEQVIFMWGNLPKFCTFDIEIFKDVKNPLCFRQNKNGMPTHPLYLPMNLKPKAYIFD
ncbi:MAG: DUF1643 domain-containing protein [Bacteroidota bacterium]